MFFIYIFFIKINNIISDVDCIIEYCKSCQSDNICSKCENEYKLLKVNSSHIICIDESTFSDALYYDSDRKLYYPCTDNGYGYYQNDETKCYKKDSLSIKNYYTPDHKHYYACDEGESGVDNCYKCEYLDQDLKVKCEECKRNYVFINNNYSECVSIETLDGKYYRIDDQHYGKCSIMDKCLKCKKRDVCIQCDTDYYLVNFNKKNCTSIEIINQKIDEYYLSDDSYTYYSCGLNEGVPNCLICNGNKNECTKCINGYSILDDNKTKCIEETLLKSEYYYTLDNGQNYKTCKEYDNRNCLKCQVNENDDSIECIDCLEGYVFIDSDHSQCYQVDELTNEYYKVDEKNYNKCVNSAVEHCKTCISENHCLTCDNGFGILDEKYDECQNIETQLSDSTIFEENDLYYNCSNIIGCKKCIDRNNCIETISDQYCILNGEVIKLNKKNDPYYYLNTDNSCNLCGESITNCLLCSSSDNCYQCKEGYTIINEHRDVCDFKAVYSNNDEYFTLDNGINYYGCGEHDINENAIESCQKCQYNLDLKINKCIKCDDQYVILDDDGSICIPLSNINDLINSNKIIGNSQTTKYYTCNKLMPNCDRCDDEKCLECKNNYIFLNDDNTKCLDKSNYTNGHYFSNDGINYYSCKPNCYKCENTTECIICDEGYELNDFSDKCELILNDDNDIKQNCIYITRKIQNDSSNLNNVTFSLVSDYHSSYSKDKNVFVKYINDKVNYTVLIFKNDQCSLYLYEDNNFKINTSELITELKKYSISKDIIQCIIIYKNYTGFSFFENKNGNQINIQNVCPSCLQKKYTIINNYKNRLLEDIGEKLTEIISEEGIDIFNEKSEVFQTFCKPLQIEGIDIPLNKRNYLIYKGNLSYNLGDISKGDLYACSVECNLINNNPENLTSECSCDINYDITNFINNVNEIEEKNNNIEKNVTEIDDDYNFLNNSKDSFDMFTCSKYAFTAENIKKNPGFYVTFFSFTSQAIGLVVLLFKIKINSFAKLLVLANPPPPKVKYKIENKKDYEDNKKRIVKRVTDFDYYFTNYEETKNNVTTIPYTQKRFISENENQNQKEKEKEKENNFEDNGEIHHQRLNIFNNNYVTPGSIKLGVKKIRNNNSNENESDNNDEDLFNKDNNSEMNYYPVMKFIEYDINAYRDIGITSEEKDIKQLRKRYEGVKIIQYNLLHKNEKTKLIPLIYKSLLKDQLPHKYGVYYDKRNFCIFYFYLICLRNPIINLLINSNNNSQSFIPFSVKLIKIIFLGIMMLFFNALFINQKYIYDKYNFFDEKFNFKKMLLSDKINSSELLKFSIKNSILNGILAYIIIMVIDIFLTWLFSIRRRIKSLLDEYYEIESGKNSTVSRYNRERKNFEKDLLQVSDLKNIYIWITGFFYVFMIIFFIYLVNFCFTYKGVVDDLFLGALWTFIIYFIMPFLSTFLISGLRYIGLKMKTGCIYDLSRILMEI